MFCDFECVTVTTIKLNDEERENLISILEEYNSRYTKDEENENNFSIQLQNRLESL